MREIKFRGKDLDGQFVYGNLHRNNNNTKFWITAMEQWNTIDKMTVCKYLYTKEIFEVEPKTVGQFTGLFDKNGKEIYEGDLVQHDAWDYPFEVIFNDEKARFVCKLKTGLTQYIDYENLVVVGDVY